MRGPITQEPGGYVKKFGFSPRCDEKTTGVVGTIECINQIACFKGHSRWVMENRPGRQKWTQRLIKRLSQWPR